jgi:hypothetical protein
LELCLVAIVGALMAVVAPMVGRPSIRAIGVWFRRVSLVLGCVAALILAAIAGYDGIVRFALVRDYNRKVQEFRAKTSLLQEAFPLKAQTYSTGDSARDRDWIVVYAISNVHEAEVMLRSLGCDESAVHSAVARFLSMSAPEYEDKTVTLEVGPSDEKGGDCLPKDIFDRVGAEAAVATKSSANPPLDFSSIAEPLPSQAVPSTMPAAPKKQQLPRLTLNDVEVRPKKREIVFDFRIRDSDAARQFFAPLPDWYTEALQHNIEVARVPDWMKPGEAPPSWSFTEWMDSRSPVLILAAGILALSALCFVVGSRIHTTVADAPGSASAARVPD